MCSALACRRHSWRSKLLLHAHLQTDSVAYLPCFFHGRHTACRVASSHRLHDPPPPSPPYCNALACCGYRPEDVRDKFVKYGDVRDVYLPRDYYTGQVVHLCLDLTVFWTCLDTEKPAARRKHRDEDALYRHTSASQKMFFSCELARLLAGGPEASASSSLWTREMRTTQSVGLMAK